VSAAGDAVERLVTALARLQHIDLWPPTDAVEQVLGAVRDAYEVAAVPPGPDPEQMQDAAASWKRISRGWAQAADDVRTTARTTQDGAWTGTAGDAFRSSMRAMAERVESVGTAANAIAVVLDAAADGTAACRVRHENARDALHRLRHLDLDWTDVATGEAFDILRRLVEDAVAAIGDLVGAYRDEGAILARCERAVAVALDGIRLPSVLVDGVSAIDQANATGRGAANDSGPLRGSVARRADEALAAMSAQERKSVEALLDGARNSVVRSWILAAVASGLTGDALDRYATHLNGMSNSQLTALDPTTATTALRQPDGTTCGSSSLVMARMIDDPAYGMFVLTGYDPRTDTETHPVFDATTEVQGSSYVSYVEGLSSKNQEIALRFRNEVLAMHEQTGSWTDHDGDVNGWWPEALGTSPGAAARQMGGGEGLSGVPGTSYEVAYVDAADRGATFDRVFDAVEEGHPVPVYTYDVRNENGSTGAHVTLVVGTQAGDLLAYDPWTASTRVVTREEFAAPDLSDDLGWDRPGAAILPTAH
jgi:uncharacterized protein YukE